VGSCLKSRVVLVVAVASLLAGLYAAGLFDLMADRERLRGLIEDLGVWGPVVYVLGFALLEPFFVPGLAFMGPGALVWSAPELFVYSLLGATGAGIVGFSFARYLGRDYVASRLSPRQLAWNERLGRSGLRSVILVRAVFFIAPPGHWLLGISPVSFPIFVLGTVIGFAPPLALLSWVLVEVGGTVFDWLAARPAGVWWGLGAILLAIAAASAMRGARRRRAEARFGVERIDP
jgi:uncharacterized membrane protein YdjX (TVP38/TMEM64 family)